MKRLALSFCVSLVISVPAFPQTAPPAQTTQPTRDPQAIVIVTGAVASLGGAGSYSQANGVTATGLLTTAPGGIPGAILWKNAGNEFRYERPGANGPVVFVSGHGNPAIQDGGQIRRNIGHVAMTTFPFHLPGTVLAALLSNTKVRLSPVQDVNVDGAPALKVSTVDQTNELSAVICKQDWYFDPATRLPLRVDYLASSADNALDTIQMKVLLSDYRSVSGALIPFHIVMFFNGQQIWQAVLNSVEANVAIPAADFDVPAPVRAGGK